MPPKKALSTPTPKRGRPSKAALAAAKEKVKKEETIEIESEDEQSLVYPTTPPASGRQVKIADVKQSNKRERQDSSDEEQESEEEDVHPKKQHKKATATIDSDQDSTGDELSMKSKKQLGTPIALKKVSFSSSEKGKSVKKEKNAKDIKPIKFELPSSQSDIEDVQDVSKGNKKDKRKAKEEADVKADMDIEGEVSVGEATDEDGEEEAAILAAAVSSFKNNIRNGGESKKDFFGSPLDKNSVYLGDLQSGTSTSDPSPGKDEVLKKSLQDIRLRASYKGMANRSLRFIHSKSDNLAEPSLPISFFFDTSIYTDVDEEFIITTVTFTYKGVYYNLSRVNLNCVTRITGPNARNKHILATIDYPTELGVALSVIVVNESFLHTPQTWNDGCVCKLVTGKLLRQEDILWASGASMAFNMLNLQGPIQAGWITFSCRPVDPNATYSPSKSRATTTSDIKSSLGSESIFVVLDGRKKTFRMDADLFRLSNILPRFNREIPYGSLALVAYVPSVFGDQQLGCSFCWVVVLATPRPPKLEEASSSAF